MEQSYSLADVGRHNQADDAWIAINGLVYDVTKFMKLHPGGSAALRRVLGTDASREFNALHGPLVASKYKHLVIGRLTAPSEAKNADFLRKTTYSALHSDLKKPFGCDIPFSEPYWYTGKLSSPYHNESHAEWRAYVRGFVDNELMPFVGEWDEAGTYPPELHAKLAKAGFLHAVSRYALKPHGDRYGKPTFAGTTLDFTQFDEFHDIILFDELSRCAAGGVVAATIVSLAIAIPPILLVGSEALRDRIVPPLLAGEKIVCLCVTEPYVGSDVAGIRAKAVPIESSEESKVSPYYLVSGEKKFITSGVKADYFVVAVRTGGPGVDGISLMLLEKGMPGLASRRLRTQGWLASNTALVTMDEVRVPATSLIGKLNEGFMPIMHQFNKERFLGIISVCRMMRICIEDAVRFARQRETFGKRLIEHQVIRHKVVEMGRLVETAHALMELMAFEMRRGIDPHVLSSYMALLKVHCTKSVEFCAREASQILGGASYLRHGVGERVERIYREVRVNAIGGGSEEVMIDLAAKQAQL